MSVNSPWLLPHGTPAALGVGGNTNVAGGTGLPVAVAGVGDVAGDDASDVAGTDKPGVSVDDGALPTH